MNVSNFWLTLSRPFFALAPMAEVTDAAFRRMIVKCGKPDVLWTEFVSADGLCHPVGRQRLLKDLRFIEKERPIVAQIFGAKPETINRAAALIRELGFDGVDLNFGCPDRAVEKQGGGAALIKNPKLAREIIRAAKAGAEKIPVSVKTRLGYNQDELDPPAGGWLSELLAEKPAAIIIHARTRKEMSKVPARWERIKRAVEIRNQLKSSTLIIGNGDVMNLAEAREKAVTTGADGVMFGRAIFGNPWLFASDKKVTTHSLEEKLRVMLEHAELFEKLLPHKNFAIMKKHFKAHLSGYPNIKIWREQLMKAENTQAVAKIITIFLKK